MRKLKKILLIEVLILLPIIISAQNANDELNAIIQRYSGMSSYSFRFKVEVSNLLDRSAKPEVSNSELKVKGNSYFFKDDDYTVVRNKNLFLIVDHDQQIIVLDSSVKKSNTKLAYNPKQILDSILVFVSSMKFENVNDETSKITLLLDFPEIEKLEIFYSFKSKEYKKLIYYYSKTTSGFRPKVDVTFLSFERNPVIDESAFSLNQFITLSKQGYKLTNKYFSYQLFNQLE